MQLWEVPLSTMSGNIGWNQTNPSGDQWANAHTGCLAIMGQVLELFLPAGDVLRHYANTAYPIYC